MSGDTPPPFWYRRLIHTAARVDDLRVAIANASDFNESGGTPPPFRYRRLIHTAARLIAALDEETRDAAAAADPDKITHVATAISRVYAPGPDIAKEPPRLGRHALRLARVVLGVAAEWKSGDTTTDTDKIVHVAEAVARVNGPVGVVIEKDRRVARVALDAAIEWDASRD